MHTNLSRDFQVINKFLNEADLFNITSTIAWHSNSKYPWMFYEVIDQLLGPWGEKGYPIGYGKFYCIAFNTNPKLKANPATAAWVKKTTIELQLPLRDLVVKYFKEGKLDQLTEAEFRKAAFDSHPMAYIRGGLVDVIRTAPELLMVVAAIPSKEFVNPNSFTPTILQVGKTLGLLSAKAAHDPLGALSVYYSAKLHILIHPIRTAEAAIYSASLAYQNIMVSPAQNNTYNHDAEINHLVTLLNSGKLDDMNILNRITARSGYNIHVMPMQLTPLPHRVIDAANKRKRYIANYCRQMIKVKPNLKQKLDKQYPGWSYW